MRVYEVTVKYNVEIDDPKNLTPLHVMDAVYQSQLEGSEFRGTTKVDPRLEFYVEEVTMSIKEVLP